MVIALRCSDGFSGAVSGKYFNTLSLTDNLPSACASPTAVEVKLLVSDHMMCGLSAVSGAHQLSATTFPFRTSIKL